jgi:hypothetical protein
LWIILALLAYVGCRLLPPLALGAAGTAAAVALLLAAGIFVPQSIRRSGAPGWIALIALGFFSTLLVTTLLRDLLLLGARFAVTASRYQTLLGPSALGALLTTVAVTAVGFVIARRPRIVDVDIPVARLPRALHGFSITQISDVHVGPTIRRDFVERLVGRVNGLQADLIAFVETIGASRRVLRDGKPRVLFRRGRLDPRNPPIGLDRAQESARRTRSRWCLARAGGGQ